MTGQASALGTLPVRVRVGGRNSADLQYESATSTDFVLLLLLRINYHINTELSDMRSTIWGPHLKGIPLCTTWTGRRGQPVVPGDECGFDSSIRKLHKSIFLRQMKFIRLHSTGTMETIKGHEASEQRRTLPGSSNGSAGLLCTTRGLSPLPTPN